MLGYSVVTRSVNTVYSRKHCGTTCGSIVQHSIIGLLRLLHGAHAFTMLECLRHLALQFSTIGAQACGLTLSVKGVARGPVMHAALCGCKRNVCHMFSAAIAQWLRRNVCFATKHHS